MQLSRFSLFVAFTSTIAGALAAPLNSTLTTRAAAQVITKCTVPNTVAITFDDVSPYLCCTVPNTVAITFDDGPYEYIYDISNALINAGAKGTFFFNGNNYQCIYSADNQARLKHVYKQGHQVASHTWGHKDLSTDLSTLTWDQVHDEMWRVEEALQRILGVTPAFMRPPFGSYNGKRTHLLPSEYYLTLTSADNVRNVAGVRGQKIANWDFDSRDSAGASAADSKRLYDEIIAQRPSTILTLNHETYRTTALVTLAECLGEQAYQYIGSPQTPDDSWTC
ncbi:unnamed protein product [Rhizoctonia solani]|uniref:NodB homology domain-containing protein n=1 Tax=Rhizoctonia solani TaxID=456999 RepID=A0A8H3HNS8_9AGAM|nr:unnamed protein product [Rhizoctonia solani]